MSDLPRWARLTLVGVWTACAVALTVAGVLRLRWERLEGDLAFIDHWQGAVCGLGPAGCIRVSRQVVPPPAEALPPRSR